MEASMSALSLAITQFFSALGVLFAAFESMAKTTHNLATVAEESSGQYMDQARIERAMKLASLEAERAAAQLKLTHQP
jgi:hypothetical protein